MTDLIVRKMRFAFADHRVPFAKGGRTDQDNGTCKCPHHNRHKADTVV
jgi:hypothetical protein